MDGIVTNPTIEFLLKQVYALHKQIVQEFEEKLRYQENSNECKNCDELKKALADCKGGYFDDLQLQKQQIDLLEKRLSTVKSFKSSKITRNIGIQAAETILSVASSSNSSRSRKRLSTVPIDVACKKLCEEEFSDASSTLLKNESPGKSKTVRIDFLPLDKSTNSLEREPPVVLVPESPQSEGSFERRKLDAYEEIRILSCHKKVAKWLKDVEVPETLPTSAEDILVPLETINKGSPSIINFGMESNIHVSDPTLSGPIKDDGLTKTAANRSPFFVRNVDANTKCVALSPRHHPSVGRSSKSSRKVKPLFDEVFGSEKSLRGDASPIFLRNETIDVPSPNRNLIACNSKKTEETTSVKKRVLRQSKLKLKKQLPPVVADNVPPKATNNLCRDATSTDNGREKRHDCKTIKTERNSLTPENKENEVISECDEESEDLLITGRNNYRTDALQEMDAGTSELSGTRNKLNNSFDNIPSKSEKVAFKVKEATVRDQAARDKMPGHECDNCLRYYDNLDLPEEERMARLQLCSKHRANNTLPTTPEHYWEIGFPDTPECKERGYLDETQKVQLRPRRRRPLK